MHPDVPYFSILLCLTPDDFTCQVESAATQWVNQLQTAHMRYDLLTMHPTLVLFLLCLITPDDFTRQVESAATQPGAKLEGGGGYGGGGPPQIRIIPIGRAIKDFKVRGCLAEMPCQKQ
jgi:hypothetical protein